MFQGFEVELCAPSDSICQKDPSTAGRVNPAAASFSFSMFHEDDAMTQQQPLQPQNVKPASRRSLLLSEILWCLNEH